jgi:hypothetical protein
LHSVLDGKEEPSAPKAPAVLRIHHSSPQSDYVCMYSHMLEMQEHNAALERMVAQQAVVLQQAKLPMQHVPQPQQHDSARDSLSDPNFQAALNAHTSVGDEVYASDVDDEQDSLSSSDGTEQDASDSDDEAAEQSRNNPNPAADSSIQPAPVDTTDAIAGAARAALRIDTSTDDAAANAALMQRLLSSCVQRMAAQEELLQQTMAAVQPFTTTYNHGETIEDSFGRLRAALINAVRVAHSFIHDNAMIQADAAERESQVGICKAAGDAPTREQIALTGGFSDSFICFCIPPAACS